MTMQQFRMLPPSAAPLAVKDVVAGLCGNTAMPLESLRQAVQHRFGVRHVFFTSAGRAGLSVGLQALQALCPERNEVLLPAYTSFSVPSAVVNAGLKIRLYDLHPETLAPDLASLENALSSQTLCVVACHLFGYPLDLRPLQDICQRHGIALFDDAAQAMGAHVDGHLAGTMGDVGLFSLSRGKNITAVDGGIVLTNRDDVAQKLASLLPSGTTGFARNFVQAMVLLCMLHPRTYWLPASLPCLHIGASVFEPDFNIAKLDKFRSGVANSVLKRLDILNNGRRKVAGTFLAQLNARDDVRTIRPLSGAEPVFLRLPVLPGAGRWPDGRRPECPALGVVRSYPLALQHIPDLAPHLVWTDKYPVAEMLAETLLTLPTHIHVQDDDIAAIVDLFSCASMGKCIPDRNNI